MHLKTLTVKGFKSFAGSTTFRLEPGITCVVGPNGSGKSNVVDAIAWVLGEQGAKALRGGQMSDVIFAGTPDRPPLGRAEVTLTIDNSDGALAIDYAEVSISRLLYRSGDSEYAINGTPCRLLDVQELMSDSGIGRELHVIVGQGQLDAVLQARPEDRRAFIEEAAGVLKHRKRKEKSLRKLEAMAANVARITDLTAELRRQLGPLGRQAEVARRAGAIQAALRDARLRLLADELQGASTDLSGDEEAEARALVRRGQVEAELSAVRDRELQLEAAVAAATPAATEAADTYYRLAGLLERTRGLASLAAERGRHLHEPVEQHLGRDPGELVAEAAAVRESVQRTEQGLAADREHLDQVALHRQQAEAELATSERAVVAAARAAADRREGLARLAGQLAAARSAVAAADQELGRLAAALDAAGERAQAAAAELARLQDSAGDLDAGEHGLDEAYEHAAARLAEVEVQIEQLTAQERAAAQEQAAAQARHEALSLALHRRDGVGALLAAELPGVLGPVAALLTVQPGVEAAVAAALGARADAVAVTDLGAARSALEQLKAEDAGRAGLLVGGAGAGPDAEPAAGPPPLGRWASDLVTAPEALRAPVAAALAGAVVVDDLAAATALLAEDPSLRAVTLDGDLLGAGWATGGSATAPSELEVRATAEQAAEAAAAAGQRAAQAHAALTACAAEREAADEALRETLEALHASDARMAAAGEQLALLAAAARSSAAEAERLRVQREEAAAAREAGRSGIAELQERLAAAEAAPQDAPPPVPEQLEALAASVAAIRAAEVEARLAVRTGEERVQAETARARALEQAASAEQEARVRLAAQRARRQRGAAVASAVAAAADQVLAVLEASLEQAAQARDAAAVGRSAAEGELLGIRERVRALSAELDDLRDAVHRDELLRAEQRMRVQALEARAAEEFGVAPTELLAEFGPHRDVPPDADAGPDAVARPFDREVQLRRAAAADRQLAQLGRINPLALEEFGALEERHAFLSAQLEDLKATRRDLLSIVREVDEHIHDVFKAAYDDTAREFETVFATLFPGGAGRLELTNPDDIMTTGIEVIARPAGKKVSRLSLLSGGERSLAAIALLVAIFRARPSPFYVLDEVEAALDDVNLQRLLVCLEDLRTKSQLIIITHQKRTMEVADALYGVSMRGDGVSAVVSQRLREPLTA